MLENLHRVGESGRMPKDVALVSQFEVLSKKSKEHDEFDEFQEVASANAGKCDSAEDDER